MFEFSAPAYAGLIASDVEVAMHEVNASAYARVPFAVDDPAEFASLALRMRYDDGWGRSCNVSRSTTTGPAGMPPPTAMATRW